jgi:ketosteroid isomerase-like protein
MKGILLVILAFFSIAASAQSVDELAVRTLSQKKFDWLIGTKADSLELVLDNRVQYVHSNGWVQNKREVLDDMLSKKLVYLKVTVKEASVRVYGKAAIVNGLGTFEGINSGTPFKMDLRYTEVYVHDGVRWMLAARHSNRMP